MYDPFYAITTSLVENLIFIGSMCYLVGTSLKKCFFSGKGIILNIISFVIMSIIQQTNNHAYIALTFPLGMLQYLIVSKLISNEPIESCLSALLWTYLFQFFFQMPSAAIILVLFPDFDILGVSIYTLAIMFISLIFTLITYHFLPVRKLHFFLYKNIHVVYAGLLVVFLFVQALSGHVDRLGIPELAAKIFDFLLIVFVFVIFIIHLFQTQNQKQALKHYQTYLPVLNEMISSVRKSQHNYNNILQSISALPETTHDYDSLAKTLKHYKEHQQKENIPAQLLSLENKLLVALLYCKYEAAKDNDIEISFHINNLTYSCPANEFEIVDLTGILLDNALEASQPGDTIFVEIGDPSGAFCITVKNPGPEATQDFIKQIFSEKFTTKKEDPEKHGLGLAHLKSVVDRHHGRIEIANESIQTSKFQTRYLVLKLTI